MEYGMNKAISLILATLIALPVAASDPKNGKNYLESVQYATDN